MTRGRYPDSVSIRAAFHLCLVTTGWNPGTFLALDANGTFIEPHPRDPSRYILTGYKERSKSYQVTEGLLKTQRSAGVIIVTIVERTKPLRKELESRLIEKRTELSNLVRNSASRHLLDKKQAEIVDLEGGIRSPWLYVAEQGITWLRGDTYQSVGKDRYLDRHVASINDGRAPSEWIPRIKATDFRDAFAAYAFKESGGMILYVMRVLGHRSLTSTQRYLDNTLLNDSAAKVFRCFANSLWAEIQQFGRLDPTLIARCAIDGHVSDHERSRLDEYRGLRRSRLGIGCKDPTRPPRHVAPGFQVDGRKLCATHRCTLCLENAVIFPESLEGLAMRKAELMHLKLELPVSTFIETSFDEELSNTNAALRAFDTHRVEVAVQSWVRRIESGAHRVIQFEDLG
jgi:hypothetical protein